MKSEQIEAHDNDSDFDADGVLGQDYKIDLKNQDLNMVSEEELNRALAANLGMKILIIRTINSAKKLTNFLESFREYFKGMSEDKWSDKYQVDEKLTLAFNNIFRTQPFEPEIESFFNSLLYYFGAEVENKDSLNEILQGNVFFNDLAVTDQEYKEVKQLEQKILQCAHLNQLLSGSIENISSNIKNFENFNKILTFIKQQNFSNKKEINTLKDLLSMLIAQKYNDLGKPKLENNIAIADMLYGELKDCINKKDIINNARIIYSKIINLAEKKQSQARNHNYNINNEIKKTKKLRNEESIHVRKNKDIITTNKKKYDQSSPMQSTQLNTKKKYMNLHGTKHYPIKKELDNKICKEDKKLKTTNSNISQDIMTIKELKIKTTEQYWKTKKDIKSSVKHSKKNTTSKERH